MPGERARIREEYETRLPDIESDLAAINRLLRHGPGQTHAETASDAPESEQPLLAATETAQDATDVAVPTSAAPAPVEAATIAVVAVAPESPAATRSQRAPNWRRELAGLRQEDAAVRIAEHAGGTVTIAEVARVLMEVGLTRATGPGANGQVSHVLSGSARFERVAKGTYRLIEQPAPTDGA